VITLNTRLYSVCAQNHGSTIQHREKKARSFTQQSQTIAAARPWKLPGTSKNVLFLAGGAPFGCLMRPYGPQRDQDVSVWKKSPRRSISK